jgi:hypothetical protein
MMRLGSIAVGVAAGAVACTSAGDEPHAGVVQHGDLDFANARWIEGNASPIEANGSPIEANGSPIEANARRIDGVASRSLGINDHLANNFAGLAEDAVAGAASQGWYLPATTDVIREGYPAGFTGYDRCLALDTGAAASEWRIAPSTPVDRDGYGYVESGFLELRVGADWVQAPANVDLYLPATAARALAVLVDPAGVPDAAQRAVLFKIRVAGPLPVRDPTDLGAPTVDRSYGRMYRKQLLVASLCLPDPADASTASWIPIGAVTLGDAYGFDVALSPESAGRGDGDGIRALAPWLRFKGYIGRDPGDTSAKAEMYYTGGLVTRGDPALEPQLICDGDTTHSPPPPPPPPDGPPSYAPPPEPTDPTEPPAPTPVPVAELNARIAVVFANAMDVSIAANAATALVGMTVNGTPIRVSLVTAPGCSIVVPGAIAPYGMPAPVDWSPSVEELYAPERIDSLAGRWLGGDLDQVFRSRNTTACGLDDQRVDTWAAAAPPDDGAAVPTRRELADLRDARCDGVALAIDPTPARHAGRFVRWDKVTGGLQAARDIGYWMTASPAGSPSRCGDKIYDREFERGICEDDHPFPIAVVGDLEHEIEIEVE